MSRAFENVLSADFRLWPYDHQLREFEASADLPARAFLWQMRTGKSKETIDQVCHQIAFRGVDAVILLAPNGVHRNWVERELPIHHWLSVETNIFCWDTNFGSRTRARWELDDVLSQGEYYDRIKQLLKDPTPTWWAFASETVTRDEVRKVIARIMRWKKRVAIIIDESDDYGHAGSKKTKMIRALAKKCFMRRILTGTVIENSPLRAFSQFEMLEPGALGHETYETFKFRHALYENATTRGGRTYPKLVDYMHLDELRDNMAKWSSVVLREDVDLPPLRTEPRHFEMTDEQKKVYRDIKKTFFTEIGNEQVELNEFAARMVKLQQISSGYLIDKWDDVHKIKGPNPRLEATLDEIDLAGGRAVVWCAFQPEMDQVAKAAKKRGHNVLTYHGRTPESEKAQVRKVMAPGSDAPPTTVVGHPKSGGRGLNFSMANAIIHHSHVMDAVVRSQADERATQMGGDAIRVVNVRGSPTDDYILDILLDGKVTLAESVARTGLKGVIEGL